MVALFAAFPNRLFVGGLLARRIVEDGRTYDVLSLTPQSGYPYTLWINATTFLIDRTVSAQPSQTLTTFYSDYQKVSDVLLPFEIRQTNGLPTYDKTYTFRTIDVNTSLPNARFAQPPLPAPDYAFDGGKTEATIPFSESGSHVYFDVTINGQGPFSAMFDTGGFFMLSPTLAKRLSLNPQGALQATGLGAGSMNLGITRAEDVRLGGIRIAHPVFMVGAVPYLDEHPIMGQELFTRFVVRFDYDKHLLTFTRPEAFAYHGTGVVVPFRFSGFNGTTPEVDGAVDGIPGIFDIDTGDGGSLSLNTPFVASNGLQAKYHPKFTTITGYGIGGFTHGAPTRVQTLTLGSVSVRNVVTELSLDSAGFSAIKNIAGNIGYGVLHRFNLIFDYSRHQIIFEKNSHYDEPDAYNRSGLAVLPDGSVVTVIPDSPASQTGIMAGDTVLELNGQSPATLPFDSIRALFRQPVGTHVQVKVRSGTQVRLVTIILRDLL